MASTISVREGIEYGFSLLAYVLGVGLVGGVAMLIGVTLFRGGGVLALIGSLLVIIGVVVIYAGFLGIAYKVIADGVKVGIESADGDMSNEPDDTTPPAAPTTDE